MVFQEELDLMAQGAGLRAQGTGRRAQGTGLRAQGAGHRAQGKIQKGFQLQSSELFVETYLSFDPAPEREQGRQIAQIPAQS